MFTNLLKMRQKCGPKLKFNQTNQDIIVKFQKINMLVLLLLYRDRPTTNQISIDVDCTNIVKLSWIPSQPGVLPRVPDPGVCG